MWGSVMDLLVFTFMKRPTRALDSLRSVQFGTETCYVKMITQFPFDLFYMTLCCGNELWFSASEYEFGRSYQELEVWDRGIDLTQFMGVSVFFCVKRDPAMICSSI